MFENTKKSESGAWGKPFDLNRNGKTDSAEAAIIMMLIDGVSKEKEPNVDVVKNNTIDIDNMDINGI